MAKKLAVLALVLVLAAGGFVYAQNKSADLTDAQWSELEALWQKQQELDEELLEKMVKFGTISPERAQWMRQNWQLGETEYNQFGPHMGRGKSFGYGPCCRMGASRFRVGRPGPGLNW